MSDSDEDADQTPCFDLGVLVIKDELEVPLNTAFWGDRLWYSVSPTIGSTNFDAVALSHNVSGLSENSLSRDKYSEPLSLLVDFPRTESLDLLDVSELCRLFLAGL